MNKYFLITGIAFALALLTTVGVFIYLQILI